MLLDKVLEFKTLFLKNSEEGLTADEMCNYSDLFSYLKYEKFKDIESYRLDFMDNTSTLALPIETIVSEEIQIKEEIVDILQEMEIAIKCIHQKFINEGELDVDDVLLYDSIYPELKKNGFYVDKYKIR